MKKRNVAKVISLLSALLISTALIVSGTFAWQSLSQEAKNEISGLFNPGGRLHDDFNGSNKDIYVENFTDPNDGGQVIYARIRLDEYMEIGSDAGKDQDSDNRKSTSVVDNGTAKINDVKTWHTYKPAEDNTTNPIRNYWDLQFGGETVYMPTFDKNKDSLKADINGTFAGLDQDPLTTADRFTDYKTYSVGQELESNATYDADDNDIDEGTAAVEGENILTVKEKHYAANTLNATVISMEQWKNDGSKAGNFWVYDTDGWYYWANQIEPGTATGLLLTGISPKVTPDNNWYYGINAVAQFTTASDDWGKAAKEGFYHTEAQGDPSEDAIALLNAAANTNKVNISGGKASINGQDVTIAIKDDTVTITAGAAETGKVFDSWTVLTGNITLANANAEVTTFTMGKTAVNVVANYKNQFTLTFTYGAGSGNQEDIKGKEGIAINLPDASKVTPPAGEKFKAWSIDNVEYPAGSQYTVAKDVTVTAVYEADN